MKFSSRAKAIPEFGVTLWFLCRVAAPWVVAST